MRTLRTRQTASSLLMPPTLRFRYSGDTFVSKRTKRSATKAMAAKPVRMRVWLEDLMDKEECKGLVWVDREKKTFEIAWCHASRHDFDSREHADLFIKYAKFTGKSDIADGSKGYNSKLKSNFRSALHSLVDCIQITEPGVGKTKGEDAVKVYQFIDHCHPEYIRKKQQKTNSQRNNKKSGASKSRNNGVKEEIHKTLEDDLEPKYTPPHPELILTDEAAAFIATTTHDQSEQFSSGSSLLMIPDIIQMQTTIPDTAPSTISLYSIPDHDPQQPTIADSGIAGGNGNDIDMVSNDIDMVSNIEHVDTSNLKEDSNPPTPSLPIFSELGVDDSFDNCVSHASQMLNSGGSMRVRKDKPKFEMHPITILTEIQIPSVQSDCVQPEHEDYNVYRALEDATLFPENTTQYVQVQVEQNSFQNEMSFRGNESFMGGPQAFGHVISHSDSVTVVRQDPEAVSQGEDYQLLNIGSMQYTP